MTKPASEPLAESAGPASHLTDADARVALSAADYHARRITRTLNGPASDIDDLRQDVLLEILRRAARFDPGRAAWITFVELVTRHAADDLAKRLAAMRACEGLSLDRPVRAGSTTPWGDRLAEEDGMTALWSGTPDRFAEVERRIDLERFVTRLPDPLRRLCRLLQTEDTAVALRRSGLSSAEFYRALHELRMRLRALGLG